MTVTKPQLLVLIIASLALAGLVGGLFATRSGSPPLASDKVLSVRADDYRREVVYHSPQRPAYTSWVGAWIMPDKSLMTAFTEARGPLDPAARAKAPLELARRLGVAGGSRRATNHDFWGLRLSILYRRSTDAGATWRTVRTDRFRAVYPHGYAAGATIALRDGSLLRRVNGHDLLHDPSVPHTAYLQRLAPDAKEWGAPQTLLDPAKFTYQISRLRRLGDGRLLATGSSWRVPSEASAAQLARTSSELLAMVSDDEGRTWTDALTITPGKDVPAGEFDTAELPGGDLLAVFRTTSARKPGVQIRRQGLLKKRGAGWALEGVRNAPLPRSGHPELLRTREGVVLHIATTGIHWTADGGKRWKPLRFRHVPTYQSKYYPRSVQARDGTIYVFGHGGADNAYGEVDQSIVMDRFRLAVRRSP